MRTLCGHDISVRCAKCAGKDFDPVQPRRWVKLTKMSPKLTEARVGAEEARIATMAILAQVGVRLEQVREYDYRKDEFTLLGRDATGKMVDCYVTGEAVANAVATARTMAGMPGGLKHPSEMRREAT